MCDFVFIHVRDWKMHDSTLLSKTSFNKTRMPQNRSVRIRIMKQKEQSYRRNRDRNTEQHGGGHSVNTESTSFIFRMLIYSIPKGGAGFTNRIEAIDLNSSTFAPGGVQGGSISTPKMLINHTLHQDLVCSHTC